MKENKWDKLNKELDNALEEEFGSEEPKQETLEEFALKNSKYINHSNINHSKEEAIILGAKWQQERMYSEEEVYSLLEQSMKDCHLWELEEHYSGDYKNLKEWFEQKKRNSYGKSNIRI